MDCLNAHSARRRFPAAGPLWINCMKRDDAFKEESEGTPREEAFRAYFGGSPTET